MLGSPVRALGEPLWWGMVRAQGGICGGGHLPRSLKAQNFLECSGRKGLRTSGGYFGGEVGPGGFSTPLPASFPAWRGGGTLPAFLQLGSVTCPEIRRWIFKISCGWHGQCPQAWGCVSGPQLCLHPAWGMSGPQREMEGAGRRLPVLSRTFWS